MPIEEYEYGTETKYVRTGNSKIIVGYYAVKLLWSEINQVYSKIATFCTRDEVSNPVTVWFFYNRNYFTLYEKVKLLCVFHNIGAPKHIPHNLTIASHITGVYCCIPRQ
jgi:uncharacterized membrane protein